jgi:hypothetical protein
MLRLIRKIPSRVWAVIGAVISFLGYMYADEIKSFLSHLTATPFPTFDWVIAIFAAGMIVGSIAYALSGIFNLWRARKWSSQTAQKGVQFYRSRGELPPLKTFLLEAKQEIVFVGVTLQTVTGPYLDLTKKLIEKGRTIRFLLLDPKSRFVDDLEGVLYGGRGYKKTIIASLESLCQLKSDLTKVEINQDRLDIRTYDCLPLYSLVVLDPNTEDAKIRIEPFVYNKDAVARPSFLISKKESEAEFQKYWESYLFLRRRSKQYQCSLAVKPKESIDEKKRAFKLAVRKELQELVDNISNSKGYKLFHPQEWSLRSPSERRLLLDTDREWELLTDFYGKLQARNDYASNYQPYDPAIPKSNTMAELDSQCVKAGQKALKDIEWGR